MIYLTRLSKIAVVLCAFIVVSAGVLSLDSKILGAASGTNLSDSKTESSHKIQINKFKGKELAQNSFIQSNMEPVEGLLKALESRVANVSMTETEQNGVSSLNISVDGANIPSIVRECETCDVIVYEYYPIDGVIVFEY